MTIIEAVRVSGSDGIGVEYRWEPNTWYLIRDDCPYFDVLIKGFAAQARGETKLRTLVESSPDGTKWQRWDLEADLARQRRLGEISLPLKVPKGCTLRCYVVPALLLGYREVIAMVEDIELELEVPAAWDMITERPERSWSRRGDCGRTITPSELLGLVDDEMRSALSVRRNPFTELGPQSRRGFPLAENSIVSHWATRRNRDLQESTDLVAAELEKVRMKGARNNPDGRQKKIDDEIIGLASLKRKRLDSRGALIHLISDSELMTVV